MKNKRWKRKAKRLKGECLKRFVCLTITDRCKYWNNCPYKLIKINCIPEGCSIRCLENYFKGRSGGNV